MFHTDPEDAESYGQDVVTGAPASAEEYRAKGPRGRAFLQAAAPEVWVELSPGDAAALGIVEGDLVRVRSPRGAIEGPARLTGIRAGHVFVPFHYGGARRERADDHLLGPGLQAADVQARRRRR